MKAENFDIETRNEGSLEQPREVIYAVLRESGKMETRTIITPEQLPWFNALRYMLRKVAASAPPLPDKKGEPGPAHQSPRDKCAYRGPDGNGEMCGKLRYSHPCNHIGRKNVHQFVTGEPEPAKEGKKL